METPGGVYRIFEYQELNYTIQESTKVLALLVYLLRKSSYLN